MTTIAAHNMRDHAGAFCLALQFLTRIPIPQQIEFNQHRNDLSTGYYPMIGALVGVLVAGVWWATGSVLGPTLAIVLSIIAGIAITGAFHEDGIADTFDSFGANDKTKALDIMRDSRLGTYGVVALLSVLTLKTSALLKLPVELIPALLISAHTLSRFSSMMVVRTSRYIRASGIAKPVAETINPIPFLLMIATALLILIVLTIGFTPQLAAVVTLSMIIGHGASRLCYERRLGGYTGDCLGATQQITEVAIYIGVVAWLA